MYDNTSQRPVVLAPIYRLPPAPTQPDAVDQLNFDNVVHNTIEFPRT